MAITRINFSGTPPAACYRAGCGNAADIAADIATDISRLNGALAGVAAAYPSAMFEPHSVAPQLDRAALQRIHDFCLRQEH